jgi:hypothetical protein
MSIPKQSTVQATQSSAPLAEDPKIIQFMRTEEEIESWALSSYNKQTTERTALGWDRVIWIGHWEDKDSGDCCSCRQLREGWGHRRHREDLRDGTIGYPSPLGFILLPPMKRISRVEFNSPASASRPNTPKNPIQKREICNTALSQVPLFRRAPPRTAAVGIGGARGILRMLKRLK